MVPPLQNPRGTRKKAPPSGAIILGIFLIGVKNGANRVFNTPTNFRTPSSLIQTIEVFHNGRRLFLDMSNPSPLFSDYSISESGGVGTGFDTINFLTFAPSSRSVIVANYITA